MGSDCTGGKPYGSDGVCDDGGPGAEYSDCALGTDCQDCGPRYNNPPTPPPSPPTSPPPPPPSPPLLSQIRRFPPAPAATRRKYLGELLGGSNEGLDGNGLPALPLLDFDLVPISFLKARCAYGRKLEEPDACPPLSPSAGDGADDMPSLMKGQGLPAPVNETTGMELAPRQDNGGMWPNRPIETADYSGISHVSDYMVNKPIETPTLPWYGYATRPLANDTLDAEMGKYGVWARGPSSLVAHRGYLLSIHGGQPLENYSTCPILVSYLQPGSRLWRLDKATMEERCSILAPPWASAGLLHAPGLLYDANGNLPDAQGRRSQHFAVYFSTALPSADNTTACIGRMTGKWYQEDALCEPEIEWQHDDTPVLCSNAKFVPDGNGGEMADPSQPEFQTNAQWKAGSGGEAHAYGAEPFWGFDGSLYMTYGAFDPGDIRVVQLNESSGRLPFVAQPGHVAVGIPGSNEQHYHLLAQGPNFDLGPDQLASPYVSAAYVDGKVRPKSSNASLVQNAFILPSNATGMPEYFLFVEWYLPSDEAGHNSTGRVHIGRSAEPTGPFYDRDGNDMALRREVVLGGDRTISIEKAVWGANCDGGIGYDISAVGKDKCDGRHSCDWTLRYMELDLIDPAAYSNMENYKTTRQDQYSDTNEVYADDPGCPRSVNITYRCHDDTMILYEHEALGELKHVYVLPEAANGSIAKFRCETPRPILIPGGSLFADARSLGGSLHFAGPSHAGVFVYDKEPHYAPADPTATGADDTREALRWNDLERRYVFTFQYTTLRGSTPELGARRLFFEADGWPTLDQDVSHVWRSCKELGQLPTKQSYSASTSTLTHCSYHSRRAGHCVGNSLRPSHPILGTNKPLWGPIRQIAPYLAGSKRMEIPPQVPLDPEVADIGGLLGDIDHKGSEAWWREREDKCDPHVEIILGKTLTCTRDRGERERFCKPRLCEKLPGEQCKTLPQRGVAYWHSDDLFDGGVPVYLTAAGTFQRSTGPSHLGCFFDRNGFEWKDMPGTVLHELGTDNSAQACNVRCQGYAFFALKTNDRCLCGDADPTTFGARPKSHCGHRCAAGGPAVCPKGSGALSDPIGLNGDAFSPYHYLLSVHTPGLTAAFSTTCAARSPRVSSIEPSIGLVEGGTAVTVLGTGFGSPMRCRFGHLESFATNVTAHRAICPSPALVGVFAQGFTRLPLSERMRAPVFLEVSTMWSAVLRRTPLKERVRDARGDNFTNDQIAFQYYNGSIVHVSFLRPQGGPTAGGSHIDVHGFGFRPSNPDPGYDTEAPISCRNVRCRFEALDGGGGGSVIVPATFWNPYRVSCMTPPWASNSHTEVEVTFDEQKYSDSGVDFHYFTVQNDSRRGDAESPSESVLVHGIEPAGGPAWGGTLVTIIGSGFAYRDSPPAGMNTGGVAVVGSNVSFDTAFEHPLNAELFETGLPQHDLHRSTVSRLGVFCIFEGIENDIPGGSEPAYLPWSIAEQYEDGFDVILMEGLRREILPATLVSSKEIRCRAPPKSMFNVSSGYLEAVPVSITINGQIADRTRTNATFSYYREDDHVKPKLRFAQPRGGPTDGNTTVQITGARLADLSGAWATPTCLFSGHAGGEGEADIHVPATLANLGGGEQRVSCASPPLIDYNESLDVRLSVALNGQDYVRGRALRFTYYPLSRVRVDRLFPQGGPRLGGMQVRLSGTHLLDRGGVFCRFGDAFVPATPTGALSGFDALLCTAPAYDAIATDAGTRNNDWERMGVWQLDAAGNGNARFNYTSVQVHVTVNGDLDAFGPVGAAFTYFEPDAAMKIGSIYPEAGPIYGGTPITIKAAEWEGHGTVRVMDADGNAVSADSPGVGTIALRGTRLCLEASHKSLCMDEPGFQHIEGLGDFVSGHVRTYTGDIVRGPGGATAAAVEYRAPELDRGQRVVFPTKHDTYGHEAMRLNGRLTDGDELRPGECITSGTHGGRLCLIKERKPFRDLGGIFCLFGSAPAIPVIAGPQNVSALLVATSRYIMDQPAGRLLGVDEVDEVMCEAPLASVACADYAFDADGVCRVPVRITINNRTWGPVHENYTYYPL